MRRLACFAVLGSAVLATTGCLIPLTTAKAKAPKGAYPEEQTQALKEVKELIAKPDPGSFYEIDSNYKTTTHMSADFKKLAMDFTDNEAAVDKVYNRNSIEMISAEDQLGHDGGPDLSLKMLAKLTAATDAYYKGQLDLEDRLASWLEKYSGERPTEDVDVRARLKNSQGASAEALQAMKEAVVFARDHHARYNRNLGSLTFDTPDQTQQYLEMMAGVNSTLRVWYRTDLQASNARKSMINLWVKQVDGFTR